MLSKLLKYPLFYVMLTIFLVSSCENALDHENPENQIVTEIIRDTIIQIDTIFEDKIVEIIIKDTVNQIDTVYLDLHGNEIDFEDAILFETTALDGVLFDTTESVFLSDEIEFYFELGQNLENQPIIHEFEFRLYRDELPEEDFPFIISTIEIDASSVPLRKVVDLTRPQHNLRTSFEFNLRTDSEFNFLPSDLGAQKDMLNVDFQSERLNLPDREVFAVWISASIDPNSTPSGETPAFLYSFDLTFFKELY